jgi:Tol biopolymer transport system component
VRAGSPRYSSDGKQIAYLSRRDQTYEVAAMSSSGQNSRKLADGASYLTGFAWSSDDSKLYFTAQKLMVVPSAGGAAQAVIDAFAGMDPDLSPDGKRLVYGVNGSYLQLVDLSVTPPTQRALPVKGSSPRFSPDGTQIAFQSENRIKRMLLADGTVTEVVDAEDFFASVDWFMDGKRLVVGTKAGIELVDLTVTPPSRKLLFDPFAVMHVDLSPDELSIVYEVNGQADLRVLTGF